MAGASWPGSNGTRIPPGCRRSPIRCPLSWDCWRPPPNHHPARQGTGLPAGRAPARNARTREGRLQVESAQLHHLLPRLIGAYDYHRQGGGIGTRGGPGEQQIEVERRRIRKRLKDLERELEDVRRQRQQQRAARRGSELVTVAIVGYTNAGKSTLLNTLTRAGVRAENKLFATLDPTTRRLRLDSGRELLLTDTVGFIQKLPTDLVASFLATLEEVTHAYIVLHVPHASSHAAAEH